MGAVKSLLGGLAGAVAVGAMAASSALAAPACKGTIYLTFDTGSQSQAEFIADTLKKHQIKATFFLANEKTTRGDYSLDASWGPYWKRLAGEGHLLGTHTFDHVYFRKANADGTITVRPQFGANAGKDLSWTPAQFCSELKRVDARVKEFTGQGVAPLWRAPGGRTNPVTLAAALDCGYRHVGWAPAGFLGDELSSEAYSNDALLKRALRDLRDGDITMAHLGIWSRREPWAPGVLEPLITGLKQRGMCFATLKDHPQYRDLWK
jgi:peptidoglycan/xylan/chitin deacetylase (PgdA/CDA1 family)